MDAITLYMGNAAPEFLASELQSTPHVSLGRKHGDGFQGHQLQQARELLEGELEVELLFGNPVILFRAQADVLTEVIHARTPQPVRSPQAGHSLSEPPRILARGGSLTHVTCCHRA